MQGGYTVYYDGGCPRCVREMNWYRRFDPGGQVRWVDIVGREPQLEAEGIDPRRALLELHLRYPDGRLVIGVAAFIVLWRQVPWMRPAAWLVGLPVVRPAVEAWYRWVTERRLRRTGRLCDGDGDCQ